MNQLATEQLLPRHLESSGGEPIRELAILGVLTPSLATLGSLDTISSFASLVFIVIFGLISYLAYQNRSDTIASVVIPVVGAGGAIATVLVLVWYLATIEPETFVVIFLLVLVIVVELFYFERAPIEEGVEDIA